MPHLIGLLLDEWVLYLHPLRLLLDHRQPFMRLEVGEGGLVLDELSFYIKLFVLRREHLVHSFQVF